MRGSVFHVIPHVRNLLMPPILPPLGTTSVNYQKDCLRNHHCSNVQVLPELVFLMGHPCGKLFRYSLT